MLLLILSSSVQRSVYKDLVMLLQKDKFLTVKQLKAKGEISFEQDCLVEGGSLDQMHNGTAYREVRQYQSNHHLVRFYFVTRIYSRYMQTIMQDFRSGLKPDILIINSCVWDISRYNSNWTKDYKENLHQFFNELKGTLPVESLVIWNLTMPVGKRIKGGFLVLDKCKATTLQYCYDVVEANFYSGTLANAYGMDVLDLHYQFRFLLHHRARDGVHWNAIAHRRVSTHLLLHTAQAWGVKMLSPLMSVGEWKDCVLISVQCSGVICSHQVATLYFVVHSCISFGESQTLIVCLCVVFFFKEHTIAINEKPAKQRNNINPGNHI
uniref:Family with sequence similarity 113 n=1 Tax=Sphaeramia orbicularis TaxID=375764 RepID=A0A673CL11_9TELE